MKFDPGAGGATLDPAPTVDDFRAEVLRGLRQTPPRLPSKFFYDDRGSELFGAICELPEYYVTRTELSILQQSAPEMARALGPRLQLIGLGTGAGTKTRLIIEALQDPVAYLPVDISREQLYESAERFRADFPAMETLPVWADYMQPVQLPTPKEQPARTVVYFPGSTIGNLEPGEALNFLKRIARVASPDGGLLIGVDLEKDRAVLEAAYNDAAGVTAAFNLNLLTRANRELGTDFDLAGWRHRAVYNEPRGRIEMHLLSRQKQTVHLDEEAFAFAPDDFIITEFSYKHTPKGFAEMAAQAGFERQEMWTDSNNYFAVFFFTARA